MSKVLDGVVDLDLAHLVNLHRSGQIAGVMRYVAPAAWNWPKAITAAKYAEYQRAGIPVALNFESTGRSWRGGFNAGLDDGNHALLGADEVGHPRACPILFSADEPVGGNDLDTWANYAHGVNQASGGRLQGFYVDVVGVDHLSSLHLGSIFWQPNARGWPGDSIDDPRAALVQRTSHSFPMFASNLYDESDVQHDWWGQNPIPTTAPANPPATQPGGGLVVGGQEDEMFINPYSADPFRPEFVTLDVNSRNVVLGGGCDLVGWPARTGLGIRYVSIPTSNVAVISWDRHADWKGFTVVDAKGHAYVYRFVHHAAKTKGKS